jgi:hypothetical protein
MQTMTTSISTTSTGAAKPIKRTAVKAVLTAAVLGLAMQAGVKETQAQQPSSRAVAKAKAFLDTAQRGRFILGYLHLGSSYGGHSYVETRGVNSNGRTKAGHFGLVYRFTWDGTGYTNVAFLFDEDGDFYELQAMDHNATFNVPFVKANVTIQVLGNVLIEAFKDQMKDADRQFIQQCIDRADAEALLEFGLQLQQSVGR